MQKKSKENRTKNSVQHISLSETIREIHKLTGHRLNLRLTELNGLRDSIVHCNPQGMKAYSQEVLGKQKVKNLRGNVVVMRLSSKEIKNMSDIEKEAEVEQQDLFGWFVEIFNSGLPKKAFETFGESINAIELLTSFSAMCFEERKGIFGKIAIQGKLPSQEDIDLFQSYFLQPYVGGNENAQDFFDKIKKCFKNLTN